VGDAKAPGADQAPTKPAERRKLVATFAARYQVEPDKLLATLKDTAFKQPGKMEGNTWKAGPEVTDAQMMALLVVANEYHLNPFTREIYAFASRGGGIVPIISIDGWIRIVNERPELEYVEFFFPEGDTFDKATYWVECEIKRKDRTKPIKIREYFDECYRNTDPWNQTGRRMLRHRAFIQCARLVFGYGGVYDPDEGERIIDNMAIDSTAEDVTDRKSAQPKPVTVEPRARVEGPKATPTAENGGKQSEQPQQASMLTDEQATLESVQKQLGETGVPDNELFAHFEVGGFDELTPAMLEQAREWLKGINRA
jgi:hypothetical protein